MRIFRAAMFLCAVLLAIAASACTRTPSEQALRERLDLLRRGIDARQTDAVSGMLADDFTGVHGMDRQDARRMTAALFLRYREVGAAFGPAQVEMHGESRATVRFTAALTGGNRGPMPQDARLYDVTTGWRLDDGDWLITSAEWTARL